MGREKVNLFRVSSERVFYQQRPLLISAAGVSEVDIEIELDDYRSYHRDKRSSKDKAK